LAGGRSSADREEILASSPSGRGSLRSYEITNLLFFLTLIVALGILVSFVFRFYGTRNEESTDGAQVGVVSDALGAGSDVGLFYLDTKISETARQYRSRLEIPTTDDGLIRDLFAIPGVEEITIDQKMIVLKKNASARWENIGPGVRRIVKDHLHLHF
jgi:hypothetical protein